MLSAVSESRGLERIIHVSLPARRPLLLAALIALPFVVYSNSYRHAYVLDDFYTVVTNPSIRSLHNVPRYFADPATYTTLREQAEYRPVLQTTYALNYWMGGYDTRWWHFTQILLHAVVSLGVFALCRRVLVMLGDAHPDRIAFVGAALFAVHPAASGVVNYFNARSSLLTAAFLLPALLAYMRPAETPSYARPQWAAALLYALALFTKVEAVGALGALWAFELWQRAREAPDASLLSAIRASLDRRTLRRLAPALAVTAVYFVIRWRLMAPFPLADARHAPDVGPYTYFLTQLTAWWYYVYRWVAPVQLVADYLAYPVYRSWLEPVVLFAAGAWAAVGVLVVAAWRRAPYLLFLALAAFALLSPTSSIAPLAEMVNEHRPYLPIGILSLAIVIPVGMKLRTWPRGYARAALVASTGLIFLSLSALTYRRNQAFATDRSYWQDVLSKAPSSRAHLNYGLALMRANEMPEAIREFHRSLDLGPYWYFTHINLGVAHDHQGQTDSARAYFDRAVDLDRYSGLALTWRGEFRLAHGDYAGARDDFLRSMPMNLDRYRNTKGLATAFAGLGDVQQSLVHTDRMLALDSATAPMDIAVHVTPLLQARTVSRVEPAGAAPRRQSATPVVEAQILMDQGLALLRNNDATAAAEVFRRVLSLNVTHYGAHYQLAVALDKLGKTREARGLWERVLRMAEGYSDATTAAAARARLARRP